MLFKLLLLYVTCVCFGEEQVELSILRISPPQTKTVGENVELECVVKNAENYALIWQRLNNHTSIIITAGDVIVTTDRRYSVIRNEPVPDTVDTQLYTLKIKGVEERDAGIYRCSYASPQNVPADVVLTVKPSPIA